MYSNIWLWFDKYLSKVEKKQSGKYKFLRTQGTRYNNLYHIENITKWTTFNVK